MTIKCKLCGGDITLSGDQTFGICDNCGCTTTFFQQNAAPIAPLLRRVSLFLEDGDWQKADEYCERILDMDPENGDAYFGKLMAEYHISSEADFAHADPEFISSVNVKRVLRFGDTFLQKKMQNIRAETIYHAVQELAAVEGSRQQKKTNLEEAISQLQEISQWRDCNPLIEQYQSQLFKIQEQEEAERRAEEERQAEAARREEAERQAEAARREEAERQAEAARQEELRRKQKQQEEQQVKPEIEPEEKQKEIRGVKEKVRGDWKQYSLLTKLAVVLLCVVILAELRVFSGLIPKVFEKKADVTQPEATKITETIQAPILQETDTVVPETMPVSAEPIQHVQPYRDAEAWEAEGQLGRAAIAFSKLGDYSDARERSFELWRKIAPGNTFAIWANLTCRNIFAIRNDGTVNFYEDNPTVAQWTDIVDITTSEDGTYGLKSDGTVVYSGREKDRDAVLSETDIVDIISAGCEYWVRISPNSKAHYVQDYVLALKSDGTVVAAGDNTWGQCGASGWTDIVSLAVGQYTTEDETQVYPVEVTMYNVNKGECSEKHYVVGLKSDGTVRTAGKIPEGWNRSGFTDLVQIGVGGKHLAGLRSDGTVVSTIYDQSELSDWHDIVDIDVGPYHLLGLRSDGTVAAVGNNHVYNHLNVKNWTDIVAISASSRHTVGLKSDGTVVAVGSNQFDSANYGMCDVKSWTDIVAIETDETCTIGLKSDGTVVRTGKDSLDFTDVKTPAKRSVTIQITETITTQESIPQKTEIKAPETMPVISETTQAEAQYQQAEALEADGQLGRAAIAFGKLGDYSDARERSFELWGKIIPRKTLEKHPHIDDFEFSAIKKDGTVVSTGNYTGIDQWNNIVKITVSRNGYSGLKSDGTVVYSGDSKIRKRSLAEWSDIVDIVATTCDYTIRTSPNSWYGYTQDFVLGLKADGTVVSAGDNNWGQCDVSAWTDIVAITADRYGLKNVSVTYPIEVRAYFSDEANSTDNYYTIGLKSDGTVVTAGKIPENWDLSGWTDIVKISTCGEHMAGLRADGTVISTDYDESKVSDWHNITDIDAGPYHLLGLRSDGTVAAIGSVHMFNHLAVENWTDIVAISASDHHTIGLKSDGTVLSAGTNRVDERFTVIGMCDVADWTDIVAIEASHLYTIGLRADGTTMVTCRDPLGFTDVKIPTKTAPVSKSSGT